MIRHTLKIILCCLSLSAYASVPAGILRPTSAPFGDGSLARDVKLQTDGKFVACGYTTSGGFTRFTVARFLSSGALDQSFNTSGTYPGVVQETEFGSNNGFAQALVINSLGKIIVVGKTDTWTVIQYNTDGSRDTGFGTNGVVRTGDSTTYALAVALNPADETIFVVGCISAQAVTKKYSTTGTLLATSSGSGAPTIIANSNLLMGIIVNSSRVLVPYFNLSSQNTFLLELDTDLNFVSDTDLNGAEITGLGIVAFDTTDIVYTGANLVDGGQYLRFNTLNILDPGLGLFRPVTGVDYASMYGSGGGLAVTSTTNPAARFFVSACNPTKYPLIAKAAISFGPVAFTLDTSFGSTNGVVNSSGLAIETTLGDGFYSSVAYQTDTKILVVGWSTEFKWVMARYNSDGSRDTTFNGVDPTGLLQDTAAPFDGGDPGLIYSTTITQTGNILAAASYNSIWQLISYTSGGVRTPGFGTSGVAPEPFATSTPRAIAVDSRGYIIVAGTSTVPGSNVFTVVRYTSSGAIDTVTQETDLGVSGSGLGILVNDDDSITVAGNLMDGSTPIPVVIDYDSDLVRTNVREFDALAPGYFFGVQTTDDKEYAAGASEDTALLYPLLDGTGLLQDTESPFDGDHSGRIYSGCINENDIITLCGNFNNTWMVVQYTSVGERSIAFNSDGVVLESSLGTANAYAIIQDSSGNFYVAGESTVSGTTVLTVAKYNSAGALVTTFGTNGIIQETRFGQSRAFNLALNPNGSLLIAGQITVNGTLYAALLAYDISGQPITSFGVNGAQTYQAFGAGALYATTVDARYVATSAGQTGDVATLVQTSQDATADAYIHSGL